MKKNSPMSIALVVAAFAVAIYFLVPSITYYSKSPEQRESYIRDNPNALKKILNLGLDLQGGMRLVLEIDKSKLSEAEGKDVLDRAYTIIENRINALGVSEPTIQKQGDDRIIVELPGLKDETAAKNVIGKTAQLEFNLLREAALITQALTIIDNVVTGKQAKDTGSTADAEQQKQQELGESLFKGSDSKDSVKTDTSKSTAETVVPFSEMLAQVNGQIAVRMDYLPRVKAILVRPDVRQALDRAGLSGSMFLWAHDTVHQGSVPFRELYYVNKSPEMRGDMIKDARASVGGNGQTSMAAGGAKVDIELNSKGARKFSSVTAANINKFLAIVMDSTVYSAPRIIQKISLGKAEITGSFTLEEAKNLAIVLRAGALPAPVKIIEERIVGPSLGQDSIERGMMAGLIGAIIVVVFMIIYYRLCGVIAIIALTVNIISVLAIMAGVHATLTLPGIAGIILLIGMNVDANVIIFERIREELRLGKNVRSAIDSGYSTALVTILDSNITTLITAFILLWKGTGAIRGFAITMIFGITASLYTALIVSKLLMNLISQKNKNSLSI